MGREIEQEEEEEEEEEYREEEKDARIYWGTSFALFMRGGDLCLRATFLGVPLEKHSVRNVVRDPG